MEFTTGLDWLLRIQQCRRVQVIFRLHFDGHLAKDGSVVAAKNAIDGPVLVESVLTLLRVVFEEDAICERGTLLFFVDVLSVVHGLTLVRWHKLDRQFRVAGVLCILGHSFVEVTESFDELMGVADFLNVV